MAKYTLDEMSVMAKERRIDSSNLHDVMESLADYNIDNDTVRYILEELSMSENIPEAYRDWIDDVLDNYDELVSSGNISEADVKNMDVAEVVMEDAPKITPESASESVIPEDSSSEESGTTSDSSTNTEETVVEPEIFVAPTVEEEIEELGVENSQDEFIDVTPVEDFTEAYILDDPDASVFAAGATSLNNDVMLETISALAVTKGIKIIESKAGVHEPALIAMELTNESKPYLDNLLLQLYGDEKNHLNIELTKDKETGKEMLVLAVDDRNLSAGEIQRYSAEMLTKVNEIIETTDKDKDYEALMSPELRKIRDRFHSDEVDVTKDKDVEFVYSSEGGVNSYHIVAESEQEAKTVADELGVEIKENHGGGVFEIDDRNIGDMDNSKIAKVSTGVNYSDEVKTIDKEQGLSDLNVDYNNEHYSGFMKDEGTDEIMNFLQESKEDYRAISQLGISNYGNQRIVEMRDTNGYNNTVVVHDGANFDSVVLPQIADTYSKGAEVNGSRTYEENTVGYFADSSENTRLIITGSDEQTITNVEGTIAKNQVKSESKTNTNEKGYAKTLGSYPTGTKEAANTSFLTLLVFSLVMILGIVVIYIVFGG